MRILGFRDWALRVELFGVPEISDVKAGLGFTVEATKFEHHCPDALKTRLRESQHVSPLI